MEVDKDIMKHTIQYLRNQLISCMSQSKAANRKKVELIQIFFLFSVRLIRLTAILVDKDNLHMFSKMLI